ncbi:MAG: hypothetical protein HYU25_07100 [Candidatus Rokubacteria bacterium]|nr:hypothetical protein [Candidatus Rokubacteria bacterium]
MSNDEYRRLVEFLGQQFTQVRREIQRVDGKVEQLCEEVTGFRGEFDQFRGEIRAEFGEVRRVRRLEEEG